MTIHKSVLLSLTFLFIASTAEAVCVANQTGLTMFYEIRNQNSGRDQPKVKYHEGRLIPYQTKCHAHTRHDGDDWKIYRKDVITVYKLNIDAGTKQLGCVKNVDGILNTLEVDITGDKWWCLDRSDHQDLSF